MSDESDKAPEPPPLPYKPKKSYRFAETGKGFPPWWLLSSMPWWLRSSIWFTVGTIMTTVIGGNFAGELRAPDSIGGWVFGILLFVILGAINSVPFAMLALLRTKETINWKPYGFFLPLACGLISPIFVVAIYWSVSYSIGELPSAGSVIFIACILLLVLMAEFCVRLQPPERPWYQYSLRSLLIFMLFAGVIFGWFGKIIQIAERQREVVHWIEDKGGSVSGRNYFSFVTGVTLIDNPVNDLSPLEDLPHLRRVQLFGTQVSKDEIWRLRKALPNCLVYKDDY